MLKIAIAISTCLRPAMLSDLLASLGAMRVPPDADLLLIVVDNDASGSARSTAEGATLSWPLEYAIEPERNISLARNRSVAMALARGTDLVAFIDDDETASRQWIAELLRVQGETGASVVTGPVVARYGPEAPRWIASGDFFTRHRRIASGTPVAVAETANALVGRDVLARLDGPFDAAFGLSGGGDTEFFLRARAAGAEIVWADEAEVYEAVPASRANARWMLRRAFREGNCGVRAERATAGLRVVPSRLAKALLRLAANAALLIVAPLAGRGAVMKALRWICHSAGALAALAGYRYVEYRRIHGA